jgi:hypothetical protein
LNTPAPSATVAVIHNGFRPYLTTVLEHARQNGNYTCLIGSEVRLKALCDEFFLDADIKLPQYEAFEKKYQHMSSNPQSFELLCFKRFYLMQYLMHQKNLSHVWMIDSDVLLMENLSELTQYLLTNHYEVSLSTKKQEYLDFDSCPHCSFWTKDALDDFVRFIDHLYHSDITQLLYQKYEHHQKNKIDGGICDMTALFLWQERTSFKVFNSANAYQIGLPFIDNNMHLGRNYDVEDFYIAPKINIKHIEHQNIDQKDRKIKKVAVRTKSGQVHPVIALHFSGKSKKYLPMFCATYRIHDKSYWTYQYYKYLFRIRDLFRV